MKNEREERPTEQTLAQARQRLEEIKAQRRQMASSEASLNSRIAAAQTAIGRKYLSGSREGIRETAELRVEAEAIRAEIERLALEEPAAEIAIERARGRELHGQAQEKRVELAKLNAETAVLLGRLSELEKVRYTHSILSSQPMPDKWIDLATMKPGAEWQSIFELSLNVPMPSSGNLGVPRSRRLRTEIDALELEAQTIEDKLPRKEDGQAA